MSTENRTPDDAWIVNYEGRVVPADDLGAWQLSDDRKFVEWLCWDPGANAFFIQDTFDAHFGFDAAVRAAGNAP